MLTVTANLIFGTGTVPKEVGIDSEVQFQASGVTTNDYWWQLISKPKDSAAYLDSLTNSLTKLKNIDTRGSYLVTIVTDRNSPKEKRQSSAISVPGVISPLPTPSQPYFDGGGRVRNFNFRLPGALSGYPSQWNITDEQGVLDGSEAGVTRGRIIPTNFITDSDGYAMCLGDDIVATAAQDFNVNGEFSMDQDIDLTGVDTITVNVKFIKRS